jgi:hypothetical protein
MGQVMAPRKQIHRRRADGQPVCTNRFWLANRCCQRQFAVMVEFMEPRMLRQQTFYVQWVIDHRRKDRFRRFVFIDQFLYRSFLRSKKNSLFLKMPVLKTAHFNRVLPKSKQRVVCMEAISS